MTYLLLQTFLLLLASYFVGAFVACMVKRALFGSRVEAPAQVFVPVEADGSHRPPIVVPPQPVRPKPSKPVMSHVTPRAIDPVQPKIEVLQRPEPRPAPAVLDPSRFERALNGPDPNEGIARIAIVEIRPSVLPPVTDVYRPQPPVSRTVVEELPPEIPAPEPVEPEPQPEPAPEPEPVPASEAQSEPEPESEPDAAPRAGGLTARLRDATTAAAAGAVAAAKAAAAASIAMPGMGYSRRASEEEDTKSAPAADVEEIAVPVAKEEAVPDAEPESSEATFEPSEDRVSEDDQTAAADAESEAAPEPEPEASSQAEAEPEPELEPEPASQPEPVVAAAPVTPVATIEGGDDFQRIRAIDGEIEQKLKARGVVYFEHIAAWSASDVKRIGQELEIPGRIDREQWVEQAQILAKGGETYYSRNRKAMLKAKADAEPKSEDAAPAERVSSPDRSDATEEPSASAPSAHREGLMGVAAASQGRSVAEMAAAAAAAIAAASSSVTRGLKPIEPISPLSKVDPKISMPARITDAIREKGSSTAAAETAVEESAPAADASYGDGPADDLKRIRGIGVLIEKRLNAMGIRSYDQIANWTSGDIDRVSRMLEFKGRIERESWVEQARILASGGYTEFSRRVDRGEVDTSRET